MPFSGPPWTRVLRRPVWTHTPPARMNLLHHSSRHTSHMTRHTSHVTRHTSPLRQVLGEALARRGSSGEALRPLLARCLADVQGRLIFRVQVKRCKRG
jgi:hypothetical protein